MARASTAPSWGARFRYFFDTTMTRGTPALIGWLVIATSALVLSFAVLTAVLGLREGEQGFGQELFQALMHALDPGTVAGDTGSWAFLLTMLALTLGGLLIVSALIGVVSAGIDSRLAELRRGRSRVLETDHTVVLGWSESIYTIIGELCIANESRRRPAVVVMADRDSVEMEEDLRAKVPDLRGTRLVCRSGSPMDIDKLAVTHPSAARSIIVLAPEGDDPDAEVIKTLLALSHMEGRTPRVVAEIRERANLGAARLVVGEDAALLHVDDTIARLLVQTSRQSGAGAVYADLFDFDGDEIYFLDGHSHGLGGLDYAAAQLALEDVTVIGLADADGVRLNPPPQTPVGSARLVVVAADDDVLVSPARSSTEADPAVRSSAVLPAATPSQSLVLGWNHRTPVVLAELDSFSEPGSTLTLVTSVGAPRLPRLENLRVEVVEASTTDRRVLEQHVVAGLDHVLVLAYSDDLEVQAADARTLVTLLHVRDLLAGLGDTTPVVSEMLDDRNRALAQVSDIDDVVVSGEIVSLLVAQLSEDPRLEQVFAELLGAEGSEVYLRPAGAYVHTGLELSWASVVAAASARGETALGLKSAALAEDGRAFGVRLNPPKSGRHVLAPEDRVVVLATD